MGDLGAALHLWMGTGMWSEAIGQVIEANMPPGPVRHLAMQNLAKQFTTFDKDNIGVIQVGEAISLVHLLENPGLTWDTLQTFFKKRLGLSVPPRELHKYFAVMDTDQNGVITVDEFIPMLRLLMLDFFPVHILETMNLSTGFVARTIFLILLNVGLFFAFVTL